MTDVAEQLQQAVDGTEEKHNTSDGQPLRPDFLNLPQDRIDQLQSLCTTLNLRDQWARHLEIVRCTLRRYFWLGLQHTWWNNDLGCVQVGPSGAVVAENFNEESTAMQDFNIYKPNGKIFISVFAQNPATVRMEPDQPKEPASQRAAAEAEKYIRVYDKYNPPKDAQIEIGRIFWNDGRVIAITEASDDQLSESTEYVGVLESKVPIFETEFKLWPYLKVSKDHDILSMKEKHPDVADKLAAGGKSAAPNDEIARMARISTAEVITQLSHDTLQYLATEDRWWLRRSAFYGMEEADRAFFIGGEVKGEGDIVSTEPGIFPNGCKLTFVGQTFCGATPVSMDDVIAVCHPEPGTGQSRNSLGDAHIPVQMEFNDAMNLAAELLKYCVPSLWADLDETEFAAIKEQLAQYGAIRPKKRLTNEPMENQFYAEPQVEAPTFLQVWIENLQADLTQLVTGNQPALWGGNMEDQKTAHGYQMARDQSLGLLSIVWSAYQTFAAKIHEQAAKIASGRDKAFSALVDGKNDKQDTIDIDPAVMRGGFTCSAVTDQSFPESPTMKAQVWQQLKAASLTDPLLARDMAMPDNRAAFRDATGLADYEISEADSRDKQLEEWATMQGGEGPEPDQQATQARDRQAQQAAAVLGAGAPVPELPALPPVMGSSIPVDPEAEDHVAEALECFRILNSPEGLKIKNAKDMGDGRPGMMIWTDLKLHMMGHVAAGLAKGLIFPPPLGTGLPPMPPPGMMPGGPAGGPPVPPPTPGGPPNAQIPA